MDKRALFFIIILATLLTGCSESKKTYRIGVSQCSQGRWREKVNREMLAAQHLYEQDVIVSIANSYDDTDLQIRQIDSLADSGIDLLVVAPNEAPPIAEAIARVKAKGIPVIFFDRKADTKDYTAFIGGDNIGAGSAVADYAVSLAKKPAPTILEVTATMSTSPARERHEGFEKVMKAHPEINYVSVNGTWSTDETYKITRQQLAKSVRPDVIFCHSDFMADGAYKAVKAAGLTGQVKVLGIDGMPDEGITYVQQGKLAGTYIYPTHGEKIVRLALDILTEQPYERENLLPSMIVTPENANQIAMNSNELIRQSEDLITIQNKLENYFGLYNTQHKILTASLVSILLLLIGSILTWQAARQRRKAHEQIKRLHEEQTLFYTNASHQLKTPLTLIAGPVKKLIDNHALEGDNAGLLEIISRNVSQLEALTSSVLNFKEIMDSTNRQMATTVSDENATEALAEAASREALRESRLAMMKQEDTEELPSILIVDDNDDMRRYLRTLLADKFYVLEAADGQGGLKLARDIVPDIVVSDVMMPIMDGLQFCRHLKEDTITSHIPVILLTARSSEAQQMEGYEHGADAYLTKPFHADLLISRIYNLVRSRQQLRSLLLPADATTAKEEVPVEDSPRPSSQDKLFADQLKETIKKRMSNPNLKMEELGEEIGLSRVQLYRKVKALTGLSPVELLRQMRLQRGHTLLTTTTKTVNEIAYEVGFGTPGYFSNCFKKQFGKYPMEVRAERG